MPWPLPIRRIVSSQPTSACRCREEVRRACAAQARVSISPTVVRRSCSRNFSLFACKLSTETLPRRSSSSLSCLHVHAAAGSRGGSPRPCAPVRFRIAPAHAGAALSSFASKVLRRSKSACWLFSSSRRSYASRYSLESSSIPAESSFAVAFDDFAARPASFICAFKSRSSSSICSNFCFLIRDSRIGSRESFTAFPIRTNSPCAPTTAGCSARNLSHLKSRSFNCSCRGIQVCSCHPRQSSSASQYCINVFSTSVPICPDAGVPSGAICRSHRPQSSCRSFFRRANFISAMKCSGPRGAALLTFADSMNCPQVLCVKSVNDPSFPPVSRCARISPAIRSCSSYPGLFGNSGPYLTNDSCPFAASR